MNKTYAISDLHGCYNFWELVKEDLDNSDTVYFLGDAIDRGPDGIKLMTELIADPRVIYLKGNHEDMMYKAITGNSIHEATLWTDINGGCETFRQFSQLRVKRQNRIIKNIAAMPYCCWYKNIFLCHAGCYSDEPVPNGDYLTEQTKQKLIWDRTHIDEKGKPDRCEAKYIVHGHTPVRYIERNPNKGKIYIYGYYNNKIDIDMGSFETNRTALLDLDTMEVKYYDNGNI